MNNNDRSSENPNRFEFEFGGNLGDDASPEDIQEAMQAGINLGMGLFNNIFGAMLNPQQQGPQPNANGAPPSTAAPQQNQHTARPDANTRQAPHNKKQIYRQARAAYDSGNFADAQQIIKPLVEPSTRSSDKGFNASALALNGAILCKLELFASAKASHENAIAIWQSLNSEKDILQGLFNINNVHIEQAKQCFEPAESKQQFEAVLKNANEYLSRHKLQDKLTAYFHIQAAIALTYLGQNTRALDHHRQALACSGNDPILVKAIDKKFTNAQEMVELRKTDRNPRWRDFFVAQQGNMAVQPAAQKQELDDDDALLESVLEEFEKEQMPIKSRGK